MQKFGSRNSNFRIGILFFIDQLASLKCLWEFAYETTRIKVKNLKDQTPKLF